MIANFPDLKDNIRAGIKLVIEQLTGETLKRAGVNLTMCCPLHQERSPSFYVHEGKQIFKCFGCGKGGDTLSFVAEHQGLDLDRREDFSTAVNVAARVLGLNVEEKNGQFDEADAAAWRNREAKRIRLTSAADAAQAAFHTVLAQKPGPYKFGNGRLYDAETAERWQLGYWTAAHGMDTASAKDFGISLLRDRLIFPVRDHRTGKPIMFLGRLPEGKKVDGGNPKWINTKNIPLDEAGREFAAKGATLYGLFENAKAIWQGREVTVVEGPTDVIACHAGGLATVAPCGTAFTREHATLLATKAESLCLMFDGDEAGYKAARRALFGHADARADKLDPWIFRQFDTVRVCFMPAGKDPDDLQRSGTNLAEYKRQNQQDAIIWAITEGYSPKDPTSKKKAIQLAKILLPLLPEDDRRLYTEEIGQRLGLQEFWKYVRSDPDRDVDTASVVALIQQAKADAKRVEFPINAFPPAVRSIIQEWYAETQLPPDYWGLNILTVAGAALGNKFVATYRGRIHPPLLYGVLVGPSGGGKTPTQKRCLEPVFTIDREYKLQWKVACERWRQECFSAKSTQSSMPPPPEPRRREVVIEDATTEKIVDILDNNAYGCLNWQNELTGFLGQMERYNSGNTIAFWLNTYDCLPAKIQRRSAATVDLEFPFVTLLTGIQPGVLKELATSDKLDTGFFARLSFAYPEHFIKPKPTDTDPSQKHLDLYNSMITTLFKLPCKIYPPADGVQEWQVSRLCIPLDDAAKAIYKTFLETNTDIYNQEENDLLKSISSKMESLVLRLALILHFMDMAGQVGADMMQLQPDDIAALPIGAEILTNAIQLAEYFRFTSTLVLSRFESPVNHLPPDQKAWYQKLPADISTQKAVEIGQAIGLSERTVKRLLTNATLFRQKGRGVYQKRVE